MSKIVILYSPKGGSVDHSAKTIYKLFAEADCFELNEFDINTISNYDNIILGGSTVGADIWQDADNANHWAKVFDDLKEKNIDLSGKKVAIFGLGNQVLYPDHFVDGMILMKNAFEAVGAGIVGSWPTKGYDFTDSKSVIDKNFVGLALDEDNEDDLTQQRCEAWVEQIKKEFV